MLNVVGLALGSSNPRMGAAELVEGGCSTSLDWHLNSRNHLMGAAKLAKCECETSLDWHLNFCDPWS